MVIGTGVCYVHNTQVVICICICCVHNTQVVMIEVFGVDKSLDIIHRLSYNIPICCTNNIVVQLFIAGVPNTKVII